MIHPRSQGPRGGRGRSYRQVSSLQAGGAGQALSSGGALRALPVSWGSQRLAGWLWVGGVPHSLLLPGTSLLSGDGSMQVEWVAAGGRQVGRQHLPNGCEPNGHHCSIMSGVVDPMT